MGIPPIISRPPEPIRFKLTFDLPNNQLIVEDDTKIFSDGDFCFNSFWALPDNGSVRNYLC